MYISFIETVNLLHSELYCSWVAVLDEDAVLQTQEGHLLQIQLDSLAHSKDAIVESYYHVNAKICFRSLIANLSGQLKQSRIYPPLLVPSTLRTFL